MRGAGATGGTAGAGQRLVHDFADRARAAATLRAAAETAIDLAGSARRRRMHGVTYFVVAQHIAGTDDHGNPGPVGTIVGRMTFSLPASLRYVKRNTL